jgi:TPR repeat protein
MILDRKSILAGCALVLAIFGAAPSFSQQDRDSTEQKAAESPEQRSLKAVLATIKEAKAGDDLTSTVAGIEAMAREGDPVASVAAGDLYRDGKLVPKDIAKAIDLYTKALEKGQAGCGGQAR